MTTQQTIRRFSTETVPSAMRLDYWKGVLRDALWPISEFSSPREDFAVELQEASLGCVSSMVETIVAHRAHRTRRDVDRSEEQYYHLFVSFEPDWWIRHEGREQRLRRGDVILVGAGEHETHIPGGFHGLILKCPSNWVRSWLPDPETLVGQAILRDSTWGEVLSPILRELTPELAVSPPLPPGVLLDQLGTVLALTAGDAAARAAPALLAKIRHEVRERCSDPTLTAMDVARSIAVPPRALHRALAASRLTFASILIDARVVVALDLLESPAAQQESLAEIGRRAGFASPSHFARVMRRRTGRTPQDLRCSKR